MVLREIFLFRCNGLWSVDTKGEYRSVAVCYVFGAATNKAGFHVFDADRAVHMVVRIVSTWVVGSRLMLRRGEIFSAVNMRFYV